MMHHLTLFGELGYMKEDNTIVTLNCVRECPIKSSLCFKARIHNHHYLVSNLRRHPMIFHLPVRILRAAAGAKLIVIIPAIAQKLCFLSCFNGVYIPGFGLKWRGAYPETGGGTTNRQTRHSNAFSAHVVGKGVLVGKWLHFFVYK